MNLGEVFRKIYMQLRSFGIEQPHLEAGWIVEKYAHVTTNERIIQPEKGVSESALSDIDSAIARRQTGEPLAYIFGEKEFYGHPFMVNEHVLVPRPETELLVDWALDWLKKNKPDQEIEILDLGTDSGCVGLTLLLECPKAKLTALDISAEALGVAKLNATALGVAARADFIRLDAARAGHLLNSFDLVVANPPYICRDTDDVEPGVVKFEPHQALFSSEKGYQHIRQWLNAIPARLKENAAVGFEIGAKQGPQVLEMFRDQKIFSQHYVIKDYSEKDRIVCGEKGKV